MAEQGLVLEAPSEVEAIEAENPSQHHALEIYLDLSDFFEKLNLN